MKLQMMKHTDKMTNLKKFLIILLLSISSAASAMVSVYGIKCIT